PCNSPLAHRHPFLPHRRPCSTTDPEISASTSGSERARRRRLARSCRLVFEAVLILSVIATQDHDWSRSASGGSSSAATKATNSAKHCAPSRWANGVGARSVQAAGSVTCPAGPPSQTSTRSAPRRLFSNSTAKRCPANGWNGWVTTTESETGLDLEERALCEDRRDAERPGLARFARLGDVDPAQRLRTVRLVRKRCSQSVEEHLHPIGAPVLDRRNGHAVDAGSTLVPCHLDPCPPQDVGAADLVVKGVETSSGILLGTAIEHALKGSDLVHLLGFADGSSREFGTHQGPSTSSSCTGEAGALRSGQVVLSCPSSLLRPPPTSSRPPGTSRGHRL